MQEFTYRIGAQGAQDRAKQFMGNDIVRGIVELVTNSDTAYRSLGTDQPRQRPITISVNSSERWIEIRDRAGGMSPEVVREKFTEGGATSTEGERGYFGLGAKDCAVFGSLKLKTIDGEGTLTEVSIPGDFQNCSWGHRRATDQHYEELHGSARRRPGSMVRISVDRPADGGARIHRFDNLLRDLRTHYALRSLNMRNRVTLRVANRSSDQSQTLVYPGFPWESPDVESLHEGTLKIDGYPESQPHLRLFKLPEPITGDPSSETFEGFVLVGARDVAHYGFTLAGLEKRDHARRLVGELNDPYILTLLGEYRNAGASEKNPRPVVSQDRRPRHGGLDSDHPYTSALFKSLRPILQKALEHLQAESTASERSGISEALQLANDEAGRLLSQILDAEGQVPEHRPLPEGFYFLPSSKALKQGGERSESLSLYSIGLDDGAEGTEVHLDIEDPTVCDIESRVVDLRARHGDNPGYRASVRLQPGSTLGRTTLSASLNGHRAESTVTVVDNPPAPMALQFERAKYTVQPSKRRTVRVLVPETLIDDDWDDVVRLLLADSNDGVVIRGPFGVEVFECGFDSDRLAYVVPFELEGRRIGERVRLTATFQGHRAEAELSVGGGVPLIYLDDSETSPPSQRAKVYGIGEPCSNREHQNELCLHVFARHSRLDPYLGEPHEGHSGIFWDLNDSPGFRAMYADCVAEAVAEFQMLGSNLNVGARMGDVLDSFWTAKQKALTAIQPIYIDRGQWDSQKDLLELSRAKSQALPELQLD